MRFEIPKSKIIQGVSFEGERIEGMDCQEVTFIDCDFIDTVIDKSNFSLAVFRDCRLINVTFRDCKVMGVNFADNSLSIPASLSLESCNINNSFFSGVSFNKSKIFDCEARDTDLFRADLSQCDCRKTDFMGAIFSEANLIKTDFRGAINYSIDIINNPARFKKAKFSRNEVVNLLKDLDIVIE